MAGITQSELARMEKPDTTRGRSSLKKLADAIGISVEQIIE
jgi:hypothetical protein